MEKDRFSHLPSVEIEGVPHGTQEDPTNPQYYKDYPVESIDIMIRIFGKEAVRAHCLCAAFKYRMRLGKKDSVEKDMAKEQWYLNKAKELEA